MKNIRQLALLCGPLVLLLAIFLFTDPYRLPLVLLVLPFLLFGMGCFISLKVLLRFTPIAPGRRGVMAGILTAAILLVLLLQSIRQLSVRDLLILLALLSGVTFYVRRIDI